jgi:integrase
MIPRPLPDSERQFRLFAPGPDDPADAAGEGLSPAMTLSAFFREYFEPVYLSSRVKPSTLAGYRTAIKRWREITGDPALEEIDQLACAAFVTADLKYTGHRGDPLSPNTVNGHCTYLQMVLNLAGPRCRETRKTAATDDGLFGTNRHGLPRSVPWFNPPPERDKIPEDGFTLDEIRAWLEACKYARQPALTTCSAPDWWRALVRCLYNTGLRIGSALKLRREWISPAPLTGANGERWGFATIPGDSYKGGRPHIVYLPPAALQAIQAIRTPATIFPWLHTPKHLQEARRELLAMAGIPESRKFGFHGVRKAVATEIWRIDPKAAQLQLGHTDPRVTKGHYVNPAVLGLALHSQLGAAMRGIPQP